MTGADSVVVIAWTIVPLIVIAECFSWHAVLTKQFLHNAIENSIWAVSFLLIGIGLCLLLPEFDGALRAALVVGIVGIVGFLIFLVTVDVPMYLARWQVDTRASIAPLGLLEGLHDASVRWVVTHDIDEWKDEIAWMSLYFSGAVWGSLALCVVYAFTGSLPR
jgi:hypothetical protein